MKFTDRYTKEISFPLGGIGTGCIGLGGDGRLVDWEIFNRPSKGSINGYSHFAIKAINDNKVVTRILNGEVLKDLMGQYSVQNGIGYGFGPRREKLCGFPHFSGVEFNGEFPMAFLKFDDEEFPANVTMTAFNPFIPGDAENSSVPAAFFEIAVNNNTDGKMKYQIAFSLANPYACSRNMADKRGNCTLLTLSNAGTDKSDTEYGDLTIASDCDIVYTQTYWYRGKWRDDIVSFWNDFNTAEPLKDRKYENDGSYDKGTIVTEIEVLPGETKRVRFVLSWNVPNNYNYWSDCGEDESVRKPWKNYYATVFKSSAESAVYSLKNWDALYNRTLLFKNTLHNSSLPENVIDAVSANLAVLKSPTVLRLEDGSFYGWEGVHERAGSCEGTCQHVWNYAYAMCFLFPDLERSVRDMEFKYSTDEDGRMGFRIMLPLGRKMTDFRACVDGQMGAVIKCYREWKISGDNNWLKEKWRDIKKVLEYAWSENNPDRWDFDKDGVLEGRQHHTLDMELFGPSSWLEGMYLAALKAAAEMAEFLGDTEKAEEYNSLFENGKKWTEENLFNGQYFIQKIDIRDKKIVDKFDACDHYWNDETGQIKYQIGEGSSIDQMLAQWHAGILGLGNIFDNRQTITALDNMLKNNFKKSMKEVVNPWRVFAVSDEAGTVICDYPESVEKPKIPVPYCEEVMTGFEYSFAGLLFLQGKIEEGLAVVSAVRDRYDGEKRNPWNEIECGSNYARSMASYVLVPILSGFEFDMPHNHIGFNPYKKGDFNCIWSLGEAWGNFEIENNNIRINVLESGLVLKSLGVKFCDGVSKVKIDGKGIDFKFEDGIIYFEKIEINHCLEICT